jgi:hypothetical protein
MKYKVYSRFGLGYPVDQDWHEPETVDQWKCLFWVGTESGEFIAGCRDLYDAQKIVKALNKAE